MGGEEAFVEPLDLGSFCWKNTQYLAVEDLYLKKFKIEEKRLFLGGESYSVILN